MPFHNAAYFAVDRRIEVGPDVVADMRAMPFREHSVDTLYASHVLEHLTHDEAKRAVWWWSCLLREGGRLLLTVPNLEWAFVNWDRDRHTAMRVLYGGQNNGLDFHKWGYTPHTLHKLLTHNGFRVVNMTIQYYQINTEATPCTP